MENHRKNIVALLLLFAVATPLFAQIKAVTDTGREVWLYNDGHWEYVEAEEEEAEEDIPTNQEKFVKNEKSSFLLKSQKINIGLWLNPKKWKFTRDTHNPEAEYELSLKSGDLYGMIITEKIEVPLETLKTIALINARNAAPDCRIVEQEYRSVNGLKVLMLRINGLVQGIKISYIGYYFSSEEGTTQVVVYTAQNLFKDSRKEIEKLLNGLVKLEE